MSTDQAKELKPFMVFGSRPPLGNVGVVRDFRPLPVDANDALPERAPEVQTPAPKPQVSFATEPVAESGSGETTVQTSSPPIPSPESPAPAEKLPTSLQFPPLTAGAPAPPAAATTETPPTPAV